MTYSQPDRRAAPRPARRFDDLGPGSSTRARQARLVRHIAADPDLIGWLGTSKARTLHAVAAELAAAGHGEAAEIVRQRADDLQTGVVSPFAAVGKPYPGPDQHRDRGRDHHPPQQGDGGAHTTSVIPGWHDRRRDPRR